jgi:hypothetical protein
MFRPFPAAALLSSLFLIALGASFNPGEAPSDVRQAGPPAHLDPHAYFARLSTSADRLYAYSLRDQGELDRFVNGAPPSRYVTYDPNGDDYPRRQHAAKIVIPEGRPSLPRQVRLPIAVNQGRVLITWDAWWGSEFQTERGRMANHKTFQIGGTIYPSGRYLEIRNRFAMARASAVSQVDVRSYAPMGPNSTGRRTPIGPQLRTFEIAAERWTRFWALLEINPDEEWDRFSLWIADEDRDATQLLDSLEVKNAGGLSEFWIEYNSSGQRPSGGPMIAYVRNLVVLRVAEDLAALFQRPLPSTAR